MSDEVIEVVKVDCPVCPVGGLEREQLRAHVITEAVSDPAHADVLVRVQELDAAAAAAAEAAAAEAAATAAVPEDPAP